MTLSVAGNPSSETALMMRKACLKCLLGVAAPGLCQSYSTLEAFMQVTQEQVGGTGRSSDYVGIVQGPGKAFVFGPPVVSVPQAEAGDGTEHTVCNLSWPPAWQQGVGIWLLPGLLPAARFGPATQIAEHTPHSWSSAWRCVPQLCVSLLEMYTLVSRLTAVKIQVPLSHSILGGTLHLSPTKTYSAGAAAARRGLCEP